MNLTGTYTLVSGQRNGKDLPPDRVQHTTVKFTETEVTVTNKDHGDIYVATYVLDGDANPCPLTMTATRAPDPGDMVEGLIEQIGDSIRLIYALPGQPAPTDFLTKPGELLFVMTNFNH